MCLLLIQHVANTINFGSFGLVFVCDCANWVIVDARTKQAHGAYCQQRNNFACAVSKLWVLIISSTLDYGIMAWAVFFILLAFTIHRYVIK